MKKPTEAIERMRRVWGDDLKEVLAYLDSLPDWPANLTRERLEELTYLWPSGSKDPAIVALRSLAAIAPKREKRKVEIWEHESGRMEAWPSPLHPASNVAGWTKKGECEVDA